MTLSTVPPTPANAVAAADAVDIDALDVSERWKTYFKGLRQYGGPGTPAFRALPKDERRAAFKTIQPPLASAMLAFVFGVFYYAAKGMWKKGLVLLAIVLPVVVVLQLVLSLLFGEAGARSVAFVGAATFMFMAPMDFYARKVLGDDGWLPVKFWR